MTQLRAEASVYLIIVDDSEKYARSTEGALDAAINDGRLDEACVTSVRVDLAEAIDAARRFQHAVIILGTGQAKNDEQVRREVGRVRHGAKEAKLVLFKTGGAINDNSFDADLVVFKPNPRNLVAPLAALVNSILEQAA